MMGKKLELNFKCPSQSRRFTSECLNLYVSQFPKLTRETTAECLQKIKAVPRGHNSCTSKKGFFMLVDLQELSEVKCIGCNRTLSIKEACWVVSHGLLPSYTPLCINCDQ